MWLLVAALVPAPDGLSTEAWNTAATALFMVTWWITEAIPIPVTSLLPLVLFPLLGGGTMQEAAAPYANPIVFLFLGGFLIGTAMMRWNLHKRIALNVILRVGTSPRAMTLGFMIATALLSMWVSNTATTVMMLPAALSLIALVDSESDQATQQRFALVLLLCIAYGANIGGIATLIGTPPNAFLAAFIESEYDYSISFARWLLVGLPIVIVGLPLTYLVLTKVLFPFSTGRIMDGGGVIREKIAELGALSRGERLVAIVFGSTAVLWIARPLLTPIVPGLSDAGIAILAGICLFVLPVDLRGGVFVHEWKAAKELPWGTLLLFGGGLSLAAAMSRTGLAEWIAQSLSFVDLLPALLIVLVVTAVIVFLTELTSNIATTATFLPLLAALALGAGENPLLLAIPATIAASCAFMLPVATPPNAIIYGSERITIPEMARAGLLLNVLFIGVITALMYTLARWAFQIQVGVLPAWMP